MSSALISPALHSLLLELLADRLGALQVSALRESSSHAAPRASASLPYLGYGSFYLGLDSQFEMRGMSF